jgi:hypothetical protein
MKKTFSHLIASLACFALIVILYYAGLVFPGLALVLYAGFCFLFMAFLGLFIKNKETLLNFTVSLSIFFALLFVLDTGLRMYGKKKNFFEQRNQFFFESVYDNHSKTHYHLYEANTEIKVSFDEFNYYRKTNSLGLTCAEIPTVKEPNEYRVFVMGDSFAEGFGVDQEQSFAYLLTSCFKAHYDNVSFYNTAVSGSDIVFNLKLLQDKLTVFKPDKIIYILNMSDIQDITIRGGNERFCKPDKICIPSAPFIEIPYSVSFVFRHIIHDFYDYDYLLLNEKVRLQKEAEAQQILAEILEEFTLYCNAHSIDFQLVLQPIYPELENREYKYPIFYQLSNKYPESIDLLKLWKADSTLQNVGRKDLYFMLDNHFNVAGNALVAKSICENIRYYAPHI